MIYNKKIKIPDSLYPTTKNIHNQKENISSNSSKKSGIILIEDNNFLDRKIVFGSIYYLKR
jgi:hypothetical protein